MNSPLPISIQPSHHYKKVCKQTTTLHGTRSGGLSIVLLPPLQAVLICWSACWLLTGCGVPPSLTSGPLLQSEPLIQDSMVSLHDLTVEFHDETFEQFFTQRGATPIWNRLCYEVDYTQVVDASIVHTDPAIGDMLLKHGPEEQAELKAGMIAYIQHRNQEAAFRDLLHANGLDRIWKRLNQERGKDRLGLRMMLQCNPAVQTQVLAGVVEFIRNYLPNLVDLDLSCNRLTQLPDSFGKLTKLRTLYLYNNQLTQLPKSFGNLINLNEIYLNSNQMTTLPDSFGNLTQLETLELGSNRLHALPESFGNLTQLKTLKLSNNQLIALPDTFGDLTQLQRLELGSNRLHALPESFGNLSKLEILYLSNNQLPMLPGFFQKLINLRVFTVKKNPLVQLNATLQDTDILVTRANLQFKPFARGQYATYPLKGKIDLGINTDTFEIKLPNNTIKYINIYQVYPVMLFITQVGNLTSSRPIPLSASLSGKGIVECVYNEEKVIIKKINRQTKH